MIGRTIAHYQVTAKLGEGGMGEVYRARDTKLDREVAIKVLPRNMVDNKRALARFEREAKALAALNHPNIAHVHGYDSDRGLYFLVMELVEGHTLAERLRQGPVPVPESLKIMRQVAEAVEAAHEKGIVHRDLKPSNIKFTSDGRVKVLDFGLAKILAQSSPLEKADAGSRADSGPGVVMDLPTVPDDRTSLGAVLGTVAYMSPEQAQGQTVDNRTDIWSWGCCSFECLAGKKPFRAKTVTDLVAEVFKVEPNWSLLPADNPDAVHALLRGCLETEKSRRLTSMRDIARTLEEVLELYNSSHKSQTSSARGEEVASFLHQPFPWWKMAGMAGGVMVVFLLFLFFKRETALTGTKPEAGTIRTLAVLPFEPETDEPDLVLLAGGLADDIRTQLRRIEGLEKQIGSRTIKKYANSDLSDQAIAAELEVEGLVYGKVKRMGNELWVQIELVHGPTANSLWVTNMASRNVRELQARVVLSLLEQFKVELAAEERAFLNRTEEVVADAYLAYQKGLAAQQRNTSEGFAESQKYFEKAVQLAPGFASPYLRMVANEVLPALWGGLQVRPAEGQESGRKILIRAEERLGTNNSQLVAADFWLDMADKEYSWEEEKGDVLKALGLDSKSPQAYAIKSWYLNAVEARFAEAQQAINQALKLEDDVNHDELRAELYRFHGHYLDSIALSQALYNENPGWERLEDIAYSYRMLGDFLKAREFALRAVAESGGDPVALLALAESEAGLGAEKEARAIVDRVQALIKAGTYVPSLALAGVYYRLGDKDKTFELIREGLAQEEGLGLLWLHSMLWMDLAGKDPRYWELIDQMNFPALPPEHPYYAMEQKLRFGKGIP